MKVSFEGMKESIVTFYNNATNPAIAGKPVAMSANGEVKFCPEDGRFIGICVSVDEDYASCQIGGYVLCPCSGTVPNVGFASIVADGDGGVCAATTGGQEVLVLEKFSDSLGFIF